MKSKYALLLMLPALLVLIFIFIIPLFFLLSKSFQTYIPGSLFTDPSFTLENYKQIILDPYFLSIYWRTIRIALISTLIIFILSYPVSIFVVKLNSRIRGFMMTLIILPMIGGAMIQTMGWFSILMRYGILNTILQKLHLVSSPMNFLGSEVGVVIGLIQAFLPMMIYPLTSSLLAIDKDIIAGAKTLGAHPFTVFYKIVLPLSLPGAIAGSILVFMACLTCFVTPSSLGQGKIQVFGTYVYQQAMQVMNWPLSSAFSIFFIFVMGLAVLVLNISVKAMKEKIK